MRKLCWLCFVLCTVTLLPAGAWAQEIGTITGQVITEDTGEPLQGVQVFVVDTNQGTLTNQDGQFLIPNVETGTQTLEVSLIGYSPATREVEVGTAPVNITIELSLDPLGLDEVVVIGYGQERRENVAGAISSLDAETIEELPTPSINVALQGRLPGVQVTQNSGNPGAAVSVRVRGASSITAGNEPLYVIDGVPVSTDDFSQIDYGGQNVSALTALNPNNIASVEVLKDASAAAIYGSRASNGVVLITTKRGIAGETQIEFSSYYGVQHAWRVPEFLNTDQYFEVYNESLANDFGIPEYFGYSGQGTPSCDAAAEDFDGLCNVVQVAPGTQTSWLEEMLRPAPISNMNLSIRGGSERTRYFVSGDIFQQEGIVNGFGYERLSGRLNLDYGASDRLDLGTNVYLATEDNQRSASDNTIYGPFANAIANPPYFTVYNEDDTYTETLYANPVGLAIENSGEERTTRILGSAFANYHLFEGIDLRGSVGVDHLTQQSRRYDSPLIGPAVGSNGQGIEADAFVSKVVYEGTLNYDRALGEQHQVSGVLGTSYEDNTYEDNFVVGVQFPTEYFRYLNSAASITDGGSELEEWSLLSYFGRLSYTFDDRYTATFNIRRDGSSRFGEENRFGTFPSASFLWRVSQEDFMQNQVFLNDLRLRASYGVTGNQANIDNFAARGLFGGGASYNDLPGTAPSQLANPELKWETTRQFNVGTDFAVLDSRLSFTADYYIKNTDDLLVNRPVPRTTGFAFVTSNVGSIENRGIELAITAELLRGGSSGLSWTSQFNVAKNDNEVTELYSDEPINFGFVSRVQEGAELGAFYGYITDGIFNERAEVDAHAFQSEGAAPGDIRFKDLNGDGVITSADRAIIGSPWPDFTGGWNNTLSYRGVDLSLFAQFSYGNEIYHATRLYTDSYGRFFDTHRLSALERWTPENRDATEPRATWFDPNNNDRDSDRYIEDGSYMRLKNATLGYTFPNDMASRWGFSTIRVYLQGQNLLTFTEYSGFDPEVNYAGDSSVTRGTDFYTLPQARTLTAGVQIGL